MTSWTGDQSLIGSRPSWTLLPGRASAGTNSRNLGQRRRPSRQATHSTPPMHSGPYPAILSAAVHGWPGDEGGPQDRSGTEA